jgi:hypothetical protein
MGRMAAINALPLVEALSATEAYLKDGEFLRYAMALNDRIRELREPSATLGDAIDAFASGKSVEDAALDMEQDNIISRDADGIEQP